MALRHRALNYIRDRKRQERREIKLEKKDLETLCENRSNSRSFFVILSKKNVSLKPKDIGKAINKLPAKQKEVINLIYYQNMSVKEISTKWKKSVYAVRQTKYRAMVNIKKYLEL